jgi:enoyl-CoA hydratase/carnithine racemase
MKLAVKIDASTAILTIANSPVNAWDADGLSALIAAVTDLEARGSVRCLILTGAGEKFFSAGADIHQFDHGEPERAADAMAAFAEAFGALARFSGVTIAAINGYALGGGLESALACDLRIAEEQAKLGLPEALVGILPGGGGTQRLARLVGSNWAKRMILLAERIDAQTALRIGLVDEVVSTGTALATARKWAAKAALTSPGATSASKVLIDSAFDTSLEDGFDRERQAFLTLFGTSDQREGVTAFLEKRPPRWSKGSVGSLEDQMAPDYEAPLSGCPID